MLVSDEAAEVLLAEHRAKIAELAGGIVALGSPPPPDAERIELRARTAGVPFAEAAEQLHVERDEARIARGGDGGGGHHGLSDEAVQAHVRATGMGYTDAAGDLARKGGGR